MDILTASAKTSEICKKPGSASLYFHDKISHLNHDEVSNCAQKTFSVYTLKDTPYREVFYSPFGFYQENSQSLDVQQDDK